MAGCGGRSQHHHRDVVADDDHARRGASRTPRGRRRRRFDPRGDLPARVAGRRDRDQRPASRATPARAARPAWARASSSTATARSPPTPTSSPAARARDPARPPRSTCSSPTATRWPPRSSASTRADVALLKIDPDGPDAAPAAARLDARTCGRRAGRRDRLPVRRGAVAVGRRHLGARPLDRLADRLRDRPARSRPTPRSTTATPAARCSTPAAACSASTRRSRPRRGDGEGVGFAVPVDTVRRSLDAAARGRHGRTTPTSASRAPPSTRSSPSASTCRRPRAPGSRRSRRRPGRRGRPARRAASTSVPGARVPARRRRRRRRRARAGPRRRPTSPRRCWPYKPGQHGDADGPPRRRRPKRIAVTLGTRPLDARRAERRR